MKKFSCKKTKMLDGSIKWDCIPYKEGESIKITNDKLIDHVAKDRPKNNNKKVKKEHLVSCNTIGYPVSTFTLTAKKKQRLFSNINKN